MNVFRILGIALFIVGVICLVFAWTSSHAFVDKLSYQATGRFTQQTMWYLIGGVVLFVVGWIFFSRGRST